MEGHDNGEGGMGLGCTEVEKKERVGAVVVGLRRPSEKEEVGHERRVRWQRKRSMACSLVLRRRSMSM